jgi:hypothetical protein
MPLILPGNVASATAAGYSVANSCRFNEPDDPSMLKTSGSGNQRTFTVSVWLKRSKISSFMAFYSQVTDDNNYFMMNFQGSDKLDIHDLSGGAEQLNFRTTAVFRDVSAWYHIVVAVDTTQATEGNRFKLWVNGTQQTVFDNSAYPDQNDDIAVNVSGEKTRVGAGYDTANYHFDGYIAEVCSIDGTAYSNTDFGEFDEDSPTIWKPKNVSGLTFGTNGFYLDFEDSANLGNDANGGTDLTETNLDATDQATDTPTNNFCTLLPDSTWDVGNKSAFSEGNCYASSVQGGHGLCYGTIGASSGKWYFEAKLISQNMHGNSNNLGVITGILGEAISEIDIGSHATGYVWNGQGDIGNNGSTLSWGSLDSESVNDILQCAYDLDNNKLYYGVNGTWDNSSDPAANSNGQAITAAASTPLGMYLPAYMDKSSVRSYVYAYNFGGCPAFTVASGNADDNGYGNFEYDVPSGYYALCTKNLAEFG